MATAAQVLEEEPVRFIHCAVAMYCLDCKAISNAKGENPSCPACASGKLWPLAKWLEPESMEGVA